MRIINASETGTLVLGFQGEDQRLEIRFPLVDEKTGRNITEEFPGGSFSISIMLPGDPAEHIVGSEDFRIEGNWLIWTVKEAYTVGFGEGTLQLNYAFGGMAKSRIWKTNVRKSINSGSGTVPSWSDWKTELLNAANAVEQAVDSYDEMTASAEDGDQTSAHIDRTGDHPVLQITIKNNGGGADIDDSTTASNKTWSSQKISSALSGKQNTLTFDSTPTENSNNPVKSGGVYSALAQQSETIVELNSAIKYFPDSAAFTQYVRSLFQLKTWYNGSFINDTTRLSTTQPMSFPFDIKVNNPFYTVAVLKWSSKTPSSSSYIERVIYEDPSIVIKAGTLFTLTYSKTGNAEFAVTDAELVTVTSVFSNDVATNTANIKNINSRLIEVISVQWAQGGLAWNGVTERSDRIHAVNYLPNSVHKIKALDGYVFAFAGYNAENWLGYYSSAGTFGGTSVWLTELDVDAVRRQYPYYTLKFVGAKTNLTDSLTPSDATNFIFYNEDVNTIIRNSLPSYDTQESFNLIPTPIWQSNFGTVAVPQGICCSGDYVYVGGQTQGGSDSAPSYILKLSKTGTVIASNTSDNFGHCSGIAVDSVRNVAYIAKWDSATNYSTLYKVDTSTLEQVAEINMANTLSDIVPNYEGFVSCAYNEKYDKLILAMRGTPHHFAVLNPDDLSVDRVFRYAEPASGFTLQGIMSIDDMVYLSWCRGTIVSDNVENFISAYDWNGCEIFTAPVPRNDELEGVAFDGVSFYFTYQEFHTANLYAPVYKAAYKPSRVTKAEVSTTYVGNYN